MAEIDQIRQILTWIGFLNIQEREANIIEVFESCDDLLALKSTDISSLNRSFGRRMIQNSQLVFDNHKTKKLQSLLYWVQNFYRISKMPKMFGLNAAMFSNALVTASRREDVRQKMSATSSEKSKEASPGPLVSELKWSDWEANLENFLSTIQ